MKRFFALLGMLALLVASVPVPALAANLSFLEINFGEPTATLPLDRFLKHKFTIKNTDSKAHTISFSLRIKETDQDVVGWPQPQTLYFDAGQTLDVQTFLDENWGKIDKEKYGSHTLTGLWTFEEKGVKRNETVTYKYSVLKDAEVTGDLKLTGKVVDTNNKAVASARVSLSTGNFTKTTTAGSDGTFSFDGVPQRDDWMLKATTGGTAGNAPAGSGGMPGNPGQAQPGAAQPGQDCAPPPAPCNPPSGSVAPDMPVTQPGNQTLNLVPRAQAATTTAASGYAFVTPGITNYTIQVQPASLTANYTVSTTVKSNIGYWKGDVDDAEQYVLVAQGMENWSDTNLKSKSKLELYTFDGEQKWAYDMGWEAWGVDLSGDAKYAAFSTSNSTKTLGVIDAATGKSVWTKTAKEFSAGKTVTQAAEGGGIDSKEVAISSTNKYLGVGHGGGDVFLAELTTGKVLWSQNLKGQVRGILFDAKDEYMYAGSGDGNAYKLKISDGSIVWKTSIGSWPFTNGFKLSKDGKYLGSASKVGEVTVIDTETGKQLWQVDQLGNASLISFSPDGKYVFAGGGGAGASTLYETTTGKKLWRLDRFAHQGMFSADGKFIMVGDQNVDFYDLGGNHIGTVSPEGEKAGGRGQGQFAYITKDASKFVYARRDMTEEGNVLIFGNGATVIPQSITSTNDADLAATTSGVVQTESASNSSFPVVWVSLGVVILALIGGVVVFLKKKKAAA